MPMMAFFPWAVASEPITVGEFRIVPFAVAARDLDPTMQQAVRTVLSAYVPRRGSPDRIPLVHHADAGLTDELDESRRADYFRFGELAAFAGLAAREYFGLRYWNRDSLRFLLQSFAPEAAGGALVVSRRRDGSMNSYITAEANRVQRPVHAGQADLRHLDLSFLDAMLRAAVDEAWDRFGEAILTFNAASTEWLAPPQPATPSPEYLARSRNRMATPLTRASRRELAKTEPAHASRNSKAFSTNAS